METVYGLMPLFLLIFAMYFLMIRPQKKKEKETLAMRSSLKVGDNIITIGGIHGTISRVKDDSLVIQVGADKTRLEITKWAVSQLANPSTANAPKPARPKQETAQKEEAETAKKSPRRRLERSKPETVEAFDPIEPNPLEVDAEKNILEEK